MFRTPTGQTGNDAYRFEAAQIADAQRELDARRDRLAAVMVAELAADAAAKVSIATERFPDAFLTHDAESLAKVLPMVADCRGDLGIYARAMGDPSYVISNEDQ